MSRQQAIVPGITLSPSGEATVDTELSDLLFDLALQFEETTNLPVDVEHVLAAIVLAARAGQLDSTTPLLPDDPQLAGTLSPHIQTIFADHGGTVGRDD